MSRAEVSDACRQMWQHYGMLSQVVQLWIECSSFDHPSSKCWPHTGQNRRMLLQKMWILRSWRKEPVLAVFTIVKIVRSRLTDGEGLIAQASGNYDYDGNSSLPFLLRVSGVDSCDECSPGWGLNSPDHEAMTQARQSIVFIISLYQSGHDISLMSLNPPL